ncbi:MAG TPA: hypothetical protein VER08_01905 [Pyrinomonadaceae bacterium]|nr:hypothetical protein [Pyrinomonadaceae bacterium]
MGLAETQKALARLYTDEGLRGRFFADPAAVGGELGLSAEEARRLAEVGSSRAEYFAASLVNKRLGEVSKLLPLTAGVLGQEFRRLFREFAAREPVPAGLKKHLRDAVTFAEFVERGRRLKSVAPPWLAELLSYEKESLRARGSLSRLRVRRFRFDVGLLARSVGRDPSSPLVEERATLAVWFRPRARGTLRHRVLPLARRK